MNLMTRVAAFSRRVATLAARTVGIRSPFLSDTSHLERVTLEELFGLAKQIVVNRNRAMSLSVISKGRRMIAGNIGRLRLRTKKGNTITSVTPRLLVQPEADRPLATSLTWLADALMFYPRTWWIVMGRDSYGWPVVVKQLEQNEAGFDDEGRLITAWGRPVTAADIIEFESIDGGLLKVAEDTIRRGLIIAAAASKAEDNPVPALDIHNDGDDLTDSEISDLLDSWMEARRKRGVGYSSKQIKVTALGLPAEQLLIDGRKQIDLELVRHVGLPAWAADVALEGSTLNYENRASRWWELIDLAMSMAMTSITSRLSMNDVTPYGWEVEFDLDNFTRDDMKTRFETYEIGLRSGFITNDQIAAWEGWDTTGTETP